jgi:hypothetical protein
MYFRETVELSQFPDLVVIYPGRRAESLRGMGALLSMGPGIRQAVDARPDGLR